MRDKSIIVEAQAINVEAQVRDNFGEVCVRDKSISEEVCVRDKSISEEVCVRDKSISVEVCVYYYYYQHGGTYCVVEEGLT